MEPSLNTKDSKGDDYTVAIWYNLGFLDREAPLLVNANGQWIGLTLQYIAYI